MTPNAGRSQLPILLVLLGLFGLGTVAAFVNGFSLAPGGAFSWDAFGVLVAAGVTWGIIQLLGGDDDEEAPAVSGFCGPTGCGATVGARF